ncbi:DUF1592 domain-containing protein [Nannocystis sp. RBIL2]|uniref:DUF1592 domain-containing protein n=1 Tax=Nannocystis sp. RBIL2 TaxID=2996788 RepID=UPI002270378B|nr:DUF1592 domain-containing protein [Nannocystis sp. RBIL2]MCY1072687.1 DUF1592 domain-containing protein [Nannocystis sp. RBIL2]
MRTTLVSNLAIFLSLAACQNGGGGAGTDSDGETAGTGTSMGTSNGDPTDGGGDCPSDAQFFETSVWTPILSKTCITCHNPEGLAKDTRMVLLAEGEEGWLAANFAAAKEVALDDDGGTSILLLKPTNQHPDMHKGGMVVTPDTEAYDALAQFVARSQGTFSCTGPDGEGAAGCDEGGAGVRRVRRLSHVEYNRTLAAVLGASTELGLGFAADTVVQGYTNNAGALVVSGLLADQYRDAAEKIADLIVADLPTRLGCDPLADGEQTCAHDFIARFGKQVYRRPLTADEQARYEMLWKEAAAIEKFDGGIRWTIAAMLQSPGFLYRTELGEHAGEGIYELTPYELASELSYLIVGGPPDAALMAAADDGTLKDPDVLRMQATRLLASADADATLHRFVDEWLHIDRLRTVPRDAMLYPELTPQIREAMLGETHRFVGDVYRGGGSLAELLTANYSFMTDELASYYGVEAGAGEPDPAGFKRAEAASAAGLLTHGAVMTTHALPTSSSPIHRGKLVRERLLCQDMPPPPPALDTSPPPVDPGLSTRERYTQHSADATCAGCHARIDPIGFGFEHYDAIGRTRTMDGIHAIDATGEVLLTDNTNGPFDGADELAQLLAGSPDVEACYTLQWARYAVGSAAGSELKCVQDDLSAAFVEAEGRLDSLVLALVGTRFFRERGGAPSPGGDPTTGEDPTTGGETTTGEETTTSGGTTTGEPQPGPMTSPGIDVQITQDSKWEQGECNSVTVSNTTGAPIVWQVAIAMQGTIQNAWNAKYTQDTMHFVWTGEPYNAEVAAQGTTSFGFCILY